MVQETCVGEVFLHLARDRAAAYCGALARHPLVFLDLPPEFLSLLIYICVRDDSFLEKERMVGRDVQRDVMEEGCDARILEGGRLVGLREGEGAYPSIYDTPQGEVFLEDSCQFGDEAFGLGIGGVQPLRAGDGRYALARGEESFPPRDEIRLAG